jgi:plasmid maintenance system antidote protein VapI
MKKLKNIHPGDVLQEEFLVPLNISAYRLAKDINIPQTRISEIIKGNRTTPKFWLGLQDDFDLEEEKKIKEKEINSIKLYSGKVAS